MLQVNKNTMHFTSCPRPLLFSLIPAPLAADAPVICSGFTLLYFATSRFLHLWTAHQRHLPVIKTGTTQKPRSSQLSVEALREIHLELPSAVSRVGAPKALPKKRPDSTVLVTLINSAIRIMSRHRSSNIKASIAQFNTPPTISLHSAF